MLFVDSEEIRIVMKARVVAGVGDRLTLTDTVVDEPYTQKGDIIVH